MKKLGQFVIVDTETGRFFQGEMEFIPWISNAFTDSLRYAEWWGVKEEAQSVVSWMEETKTEFDGNTPLKKGRLVVMQIALTPVE